MNGTITEIQRFSLNDGPGIRTTVFLKGCNMQCTWCHNPETISMGKELHVYKDNCIQCFKCVTTCPSKAHKRIDGQHRFFRNLCIKCGKCADICYAEALVISGKRTSVDDIMFEVIQDKEYYKDSGGGVTISGGEALCQQDFVEELTASCTENGISVAIETNLCFPYSSFENLFKQFGLVMCDLKIWDNEEHKKWTGMDNSLIIENIKKLDQSGIPYIVRTPLIPDASDSEENISSISDFLKTLKNIQYYELLNFNPLGDSKYSSLGKKNIFKNSVPLKDDKLKQLAEIATGKGLTVKIS